MQYLCGGREINKLFQWGGKLKERENLEDLGLDDRLILEWIKWGGGAWTVDVCLGISKNEDCFVHSIEHNEFKFLE
jgi:hypothetical protein